MEKLETLVDQTNCDSIILKKESNDPTIANGEAIDA
jgi:hypothetical protein